VVRIIGTPGKYDQSCKNESALFILFIFQLKNPNLSLQFFPKQVGRNYWHPFIKYFLQPPFAKITTLIGFSYNA